MSGRSRYSLIALALVAAAIVAVGAVGASGVATASGPGAAADGSIAAAEQPQQASDENASGDGTDDLTVSVGAQLSTVIETRSSEVEADVAEVRFDVEYERGDRAEAVDERADELRVQARDLRERFRNATGAYRDGNVSRDEYARRVATLHDEAENLREGARRLWTRTQDLDGETRASVEVNRTTISRIAEGLDDVDGAGPRALLARFTGQRGGELEFEIGDDGLRIEAESEDGEHSREIRRLGDDSLEMTVSQDEARETARGALSDQPGDWTLVEERANEYVGYYRFEYELDAANHTGEAEVRVDGSANVVLRLEEAVEAGEDEADGDRDWLDSDDRRDDREDRWEDRWDDWEDRWEDNRNGSGADPPAPDGWFGDHSRNEDDHRDGWFDDDADAEADGAEDDDGGDATDDDQAWVDRETESDDGIDISVTDGAVAPGETVTVTVTVEGNATADVPVLVNDGVAGTTDADGTLSVSIPETDDVEIGADTGDREATIEYEFESESSGLWGR